MNDMITCCGLSCYGVSGGITLSGRNRLSCTWFFNSCSWFCGGLNSCGWFFCGDLNRYSWFICGGWRSCNWILCGLEHLNLNI